MIISLCKVRLIVHIKGCFVVCFLLCFFFFFFVGGVVWGLFFFIGFFVCVLGGWGFFGGSFVMLPVYACA